MTENETMENNAEIQSSDIDQRPGGANKTERLAWFRDRGLGIFIHWSLDSQLGMVISHSLVGASQDHQERYFRELPRTFNPKRFDAATWALTLRQIGAGYVVFTTKHHNGFCMFETATTDFGIGSTPFDRDITRELFDACRAQGLAIGIYFSPDDFYELYRQGIAIQRGVAEVLPSNNTDLMALNKAQLTELLTRYGAIDMIFFDGEAEGLRDLAWELQPDIVVTRGALATPEQGLPGEPNSEPWEACFTLGQQWQFRHTNEQYKNGRDLVEMFVQTRAQGGNLLLNMGPRPDGSIPPEQEGLMRELGLWLFINHEAVLTARPWQVHREGKDPVIWYTFDADKNVVYAIVTGVDWASLPYADSVKQTWNSRGKQLTVRLEQLRAGPTTNISLLGQAGCDLEYEPEADVAPCWQQHPEYLEITVTNQQRIYNDWFWYLPVVIRVKDPIS